MDKSAVYSCFIVIWKNTNIICFHCLSGLPNKSFFFLSLSLPTWSNVFLNCFIVFSSTLVSSSYVLLNRESIVIICLRTLCKSSKSSVFSLFWNSEMNQILKWIYYNFIAGIFERKWKVLLQLTSHLQVNYSCLPTSIMKNFACIVSWIWHLNISQS